MNIIKITLRLIKNSIVSFHVSFLQYLQRTILSISKNTTIANTAFVSHDSNIGHHVYIGYNGFITKANIWNYSSIANNVSIGMGEHDLDGISTNSVFYESAYSKLTEKDCIVWNDVWIGVDVIIRRWVNIWNGAVIWANSFVNQDIPPFAIAVGSPAKILKYRFSREKIARIEASEWWNEKDAKKAKEVIEKLSKN